MVAKVVEGSPLRKKRGERSFCKLYLQAGIFLASLAHALRMCMHQNTQIYILKMSLALPC